MASNNQKSTIKIAGELDVSNILSGLKTIESNMKKMTSNQSLFTGVDKDLEKIDRLLIDLKSQMTQGFKNNNEVKNFAKGVNSLYSSLNHVQTELKEIGSKDSFVLKGVEAAKKDITELQNKLDGFQKKITESQKKLTGAFKNIGYNASDAQFLAEQIKSTEQLKQKLKDIVKEKNEQLKIDKELKEVEKKSVISKANTDFSKIVSTSKITNVGAAGNKTEAAGFVSAEISSEMKKVFAGTINIEQAWENVLKEMDSVGIKLHNNSEISNKMLSIYNDMQLKIKEIDNELADANKKATVLGTVDGSGEVNLSEGAEKIVADFKVSDKDFSEIDRLKQEIEELKNKVKELSKGNNLDAFSDDFKKVSENIEKSQDAMQDYTDEAREATVAQEKLDETFDKIGDSIKTLLSLGTAIQGIKEVIRSTFEDIKELDAAFASIAMVTDYSVQQMWESYDNYAEMANRLGQSTKDVIASSALFYQQYDTFYIEKI